VPDGPVVIPQSKIRRGIEEAGPDVGMYTSIAVAPDGTPMVTYFDRDTASLKFAARVGGVWQIHVIDQGTSKIDPGSGGTLVGMYTSLSLRGEVVWANREPPMDMGIRYIDLDDTRRETLKQYIARVKK